MEEIILILMVIILLLVGAIVGVDVYHKDIAAKTSCAQHNPVTGDFEWIEKKK